MLIIGLSGVAFGFAEVLTYLKGSAGADAITLDWQSGTETGVKSYTVQRSDIKGSEFKDIATLVATGNNSIYHYRDAAINSAPINGSGANHSTTPLSDLYKYRLQLNYGTAISYSQTIHVLRPSAGVKRTWGMIKEAFR